MLVEDVRGWDLGDVFDRPSFDFDGAVNDVYLTCRGLILGRVMIVQFDLVYLALPGHSYVRDNVLDEGGPGRTWQGQGGAEKREEGEDGEWVCGWETGDRRWEVGDGREGGRGGGRVGQGGGREEGGRRRPGD